MKIDDSTLGVLARLARAAQKRHTVTSSNLANINTPGYKAQELKFDDAFTKAMQRGDTAGAIGLEGEIIEKEGAAEKANGNTVHLESELADLQKNALAHQFFTSMLHQKLKHMRAAITGGR